MRMPVPPCCARTSIGGLSNPRWATLRFGWRRGSGRPNVWRAKSVNRPRPLPSLRLHHDDVDSCSPISATPRDGSRPVHGRRDGRGAVVLHDRWPHPERRDADAHGARRMTRRGGFRVSANRRAWSSSTRWTAGRPGGRWAPPSLPRLGSLASGHTYFPMCFGRIHAEDLHGVLSRISGTNRNRWRISSTATASAQTPAPA